MPSSSLKVSCTDCSLSALCIPVALESNDIDELDSVVKRGRPLRKGEHVFSAADSFTSVFAVRSGTIKTYSMSEDGEEQITGFYLPGEIFGMDGISTNRHNNSAKALESSAICEIPFDQIEVMSARIPSLQRHFFSLMSNEIQNDQQLILLLSKKPAEERVASFIMSLATRNKKRGLSKNWVHLSMPRNDIANYLGLAVETVSRIFSKLQKNELIEAKGKDVSILNWNALCQLANNVSSND